MSLNLSSAVISSSKLDLAVYVSVKFDPFWLAFGHAYSYGNVFLTFAFDVIQVFRLLELGSTPGKFKFPKCHLLKTIKTNSYTRINHFQKLRGTLSIPCRETVDIKAVIRDSPLHVSFPFFGTDKNE